VQEAPQPKRALFLVGLVAVVAGFRNAGLEESESSSWPSALPAQQRVPEAFSSSPLHRPCEQQLFRETGRGCHGVIETRSELNACLSRQRSS